MEKKLVRRDLLALFHKQTVVQGRQGEIDEVLLLRLELRHRQGEVEIALRAHGDELVEGEDAVLDLLAVGQDGVAELVVVEVAEVEAVHETEGSLFGDTSLNGGVLIHMADLPVARVRVAVGVHDAVAEEVRIGRSVFAVVAAVGPVLPAEGVGRGKALVHPVPDEGALQVRPGVDSFPLEVERARAVTHRMGILGRADRAVVIALAHRTEPVGARVLRHDHVRIPVIFSAFVADRAVLAILFQLLEEGIAAIEVLAVAGLVAE